MKTGSLTGVITLCIALSVTFITFPATAQTPQKTGEQTTLYVDVAIERQEIVAGPYARYAQKYLGVAAPLSDKVLHEVKSVKILEINDVSFYRETAVETGGGSHMHPLKGFPRLTVDKTSAAAVSLEESARLAAEKIFEIRRSRFDLITGEVGENVFGGGLGAALEELKRLEEEYLSLFLGRETTTTDVKQYRVTPVKGSSTYTVCRFSETSGLLPEDDLSGEPMVLEIKPIDDSQTAQPPITQAKPNARAVPVLIPADMRCRIILDGVELASEQFRISQLGEMAYINQ